MILCNKFVPPDLSYDCELVLHTLLVLHVKYICVTMLERKSVNFFQGFFFLALLCIIMLGILTIKWWLS